MLAVLLLAPGRVALAQDALVVPAENDSRAKELYAQGLELYKQQAFEQAAAMLAQSFALVESTETLFAWAQAQRMAGRCVEANTLFERFIALNPPERQVEAARLAMRRCVDANAAAVTNQQPTTQAPVENRWYADPAGGILFGAGLGATIVGLALVASAHGRAGAAQGAATLGEAEDLRARAETRWAWGMGISVLGLASLGAGVSRYVWVSRSAQSTTLVVGGQF